MIRHLRLWWHERRGHYILRTMSDMRRVKCVNCDLP
jgi:hypothetical protein